MTVHCEGDCHVIEQLGEKQDFESELSRFGFKHEHFTLHVVPAERKGPRATPEQEYSVTVANVITEQQRVYRGGPRSEWVPEVARDLATGVFGWPLLRGM